MPPTQKMLHTMVGSVEIVAHMEEAGALERSCTCFPGEAPVPCQQKYAFGECKASYEELLLPNPMLALMAERDAAVSQASLLRARLDHEALALKGCCDDLLAAENNLDAARDECQILRDQLAMFTAAEPKSEPPEHPLVRATRSGNRRVLGRPL